MRQPKTIGQNLKSGQEVVKIQLADLPRRGVAKTHSDFWKVRLERRCYTHRGKLVEVNEWSIRIQHLGRRKGFALGTNNKDAAAIKARDIYLNIVAKGWDAAEAHGMRVNGLLVAHNGFGIDDEPMRDFDDGAKVRSHGLAHSILWMQDP